MRLILTAGAVLAALLVLALAASPAQAQSRVAIPEASALYRHRVEQAVADVWGVNASPARLAAQLHQESGWRPKATSPVGAQGVAQFMPATAKWIAELFPDKLGQFDPWDAQQAILAAAIYDKWLLDRVQPLGWTRMSECTRWNFALRGYNGGEQWLLRDRGLAVANKADPNDWRSVERFRTRSVSNHQQNIDYPRRILLVLEPAYIAAGWPGTAVCS
ncbi:transglycosylase SLT domain-containing protein [Stenotrophomonas maltophilia]|uniref:transglycosylase SLT domain-containing protein n=1 Tax=Stenotrophomonas maltophilia TaxID=40324 RepID=UPI0013D92AEA|nr:transglycosylase SLT domain-containing protein [Stenotrophomonas maltophilia]MBH1886903.1 transglycosylase SLT domain-containing protein [Stenotrophomonas maltophilia]MBN5083742.1 transglycosylase SLT domain-containing protein [Stenotrophomonas maltophilia]MBN5100438.1 transglycosylase SLT domain-containing protein [Stenotrophomonas maltophilia]